MPRNIESEWYLATEESMTTPLGTSPATVSSRRLTAATNRHGRLGANDRRFRRITDRLQHLLQAGCLLGGLTVGLLPTLEAVAADAPLAVGVAQVDITPDYLGQEVADALKKSRGLARERLTLTATHTHTAPMLRDVAPTLFGVPIPPEHQERINRYTREVTAKLIQVAEAALKDLQPARLGWAVGRLGFARNRRPKRGPVDHDLPILVVRDLNGKERAIYFSYACHCVTLSHNQISGDWAGYAQDQIQTWAFGKQLALIFLAGEVVADYSLRLKRELDRTRVWVNGYANDAPCYIPSERVLQEGGYEGGDAMIYYDRPTRFKAGLENQIVAVVHAQLGADFKAPDQPASQSSAQPAAPKPAAEPTLAPEPSPSVVAKVILDETKPAAAREALINTHTNLAAALIAEMTRGVKPGDPEEYQRIPWIWRVAIRAGKQNQADEIRRILNVSLPQGREDLRDWQAVVVGGGLINGLSQLQLWPGDRLAEIVAPDAALLKLWLRALSLASAMADDSSVPTGTRYDALRMLGAESYDKRGLQLTGYLGRRANEELQMGAISGLADMRSPRVAAALLSGIGHYSSPNRTLALDALLRDETRQAALIEAVAAGRVTTSQLGEKRIQTLKETANPELRARAEKLLTK